MLAPENDFLPSMLASFLAAEKAPRPARPARPSQNQHRSLFISDLHLGAQAARADQAFRFLSENRADTLYLVGDIVDNWHPLAANWKDSHHQVLQLILDMARDGTRVVYTPGNHDSFFRRFAGTCFGGIEVALDCGHIAADGRRYLITHGDSCDIYARRAPMLSRLVSMGETAMRRVDSGLKWAAQRLGRSETRAIERLIDLVNGLIRASDRFEQRLVALARERGYDGIVCGHYHEAALRKLDGVLYANCGDWVGSNTALVEDHSGNLRLVGLPEVDPALQGHQRPRQNEGQMIAV